MHPYFELVAHMNDVAVFGDDDGHSSPVKNRKAYQGPLEAEGEKTSVMLAEDASRVVCDLMRQSPACGGF